MYRALIICSPQCDLILSEFRIQALLLGSLQSGPEELLVSGRFYFLLVTGSIFRLLSQQMKILWTCSRLLAHCPIRPYSHPVSRPWSVPLPERWRFLRVVFQWSSSGLGTCRGPALFSPVFLTPAPHIDEPKSPWCGTVLNHWNFDVRNVVYLLHFDANPDLCM